MDSQWKIMTTNDVKEICWRGDCEMEILYVWYSKIILIELYSNTNRKMLYLSCVVCFYLNVIKICLNFKFVGIKRMKNK